MKSVLLSIQPKWCDLIASGRKTVEIRKTKPNTIMPFKCYIYCTIAGTTARERDRNIFTDLRGKVIGEFVCKNIDWHGLSNLIVKEDAERALEGTCLTENEVLDYLGYQDGTNIYDCKNFDFYGWHISDLVIYDKPKELGEFEKPREYIHINYRKRNSYFKGITRPPQSWCYVEEESD